MATFRPLVEMVTGCTVCRRPGKPLHDGSRWGLGFVCEACWHHYYDRDRNGQGRWRWAGPRCRVFFPTCLQCGRVFASPNAMRAICSDACKKQRAIDKAMRIYREQGGREKAAARYKADPERHREYVRRYQRTQKGRESLQRNSAKRREHATQMSEERPRCDSDDGTPQEACRALGRPPGQTRHGFGAAGEDIR